jgi:hypothetical protein
MHYLLEQILNDPTLSKIQDTSSHNIHYNMTESVEYIVSRYIYKSSYHAFYQRVRGLVQEIAFSYPALLKFSNSEVVSCEDELYTLYTTYMGVSNPYVYSLTPEFCDFIIKILPVSGKPKLKREILSTVLTKIEEITAC